MYSVSARTIFSAPRSISCPGPASPTLDLTLRGLRQSTFAVLTFTLGSEVAGIVRARRSVASARAKEPPIEQSSLLVDRRLIYFYLVSGIILYGVVLPVAGQLASLTAIAATGSTLAVVAIGLLCWNAFHAGKSAAFGHVSRRRSCCRS